MDMGCSVGCSCQFGSNQYKWTWVAFQLGLLKLFWFKTIQKEHGLLIPIWVKPVQMDMGCSSAWVSEAVLVKNISKRTWVALQCGLLILFWVQPVQILNGLLFSVGCSYYLGSKPYQKDMGCSSVWVTHAHLDQTSTN